MKRSVFLAESPLANHRPLGAFGQPVHMSYVQLRAAVAQRLGERHANLFARPQFDDRSGMIRWIAPIDGDARRWSDLDAQEQADRALDLQVMKAEFDAYLEDLNGAEGGRAFASVLEGALQTPNDGHLHFVGDQPVMTFWGFTELGGESFAPLTAAPPPLSAPPGAPAAEAEAPRRAVPVWLWWLLPLLALLLLLLWWLFWPAEEVRPATPEAEPAAEVQPVTQPETLAESPPVERLEDGRLRLRDGRVFAADDLRVDDAGRVVTPDGEVLDDIVPDDLPTASDSAGTDALTDDLLPDPVEPVEPNVEEAGDPVAPDPDADGNGAEETGADDKSTDDTGTDDPAADEPRADNPDTEDTGPDGPADGGEQEETAPTPEDGITPPGEALELPPPADLPAGNAGNAADAAGTSAPAPFMAGEWRSRTGLTDESGAPLDQRFRFDDQGQGQSVIRRSDGTLCTAPAEAVMRDGKLVVVEKSDPKCPDGQRFQRSETVCERGADGRTRCKGDGFDVRIERNSQ